MYKSQTASGIRSGRPLALVCILPCLLFASRTAQSRDWPQWRGPDRNGISTETGLLKNWPKDGPKLLWQLKEIGSGYSTPAVVDDRLYLLSNSLAVVVGLLRVQALSAQDGKRIWSTRLGNVGNPKQQPKFPAARSTPTVDGKLLYALGSDGDLACVETATGKTRWQKNLRKDFGGKPGDWAYSESPLIDGETLVCTPGGSEATIVALNKNTGEVIWKCAVPGGDDAAYTSPAALQAAGSRQYVQVLKKGIVVVDAKTGKFLWRYDKTTSRYGANIPSPVTEGNEIYTAGAGTGGALIRLKAEQGSIQPEQVYFSPKLPTAIGGEVKLGDLVYGTTGESLVCFGFSSGDIKWQDRAVGAASLCYADGRLYLHGENGQVALVEPASDGYHEKGRFTPPDSPKRLNDMERAWAYPVVANGKLFLRDQGVLWCYDVKVGS